MPVGRSQSVSSIEARGRAARSKESAALRSGTTTQTASPATATPIGGPPSASFGTVLSSPALSLFGAGLEPPRLEVEEEERPDGLVADGEQVSRRCYCNAYRVIQRDRRVESGDLPPGARERSFHVRAARVRAYVADALLRGRRGPGHVVVVRGRASHRTNQGRRHAFSRGAQSWPCHGRPPTSRIMPLRKAASPQ